MRLAASAGLCLCVVLASGRVALATCNPTTDPDKTDIANARAEVAADCPCTHGSAHGAFVSCAAQQAKTLLTNKGCTAFVKRCAGKSTCGRPGFVTCCRTTSKGVTKCSIKSSAATCVAPKGGSQCVGQFASCCDACTASGCATTTTTTTATTTTTQPDVTCSPVGAVCGSCGSGFCFSPVFGATSGVCVDAANSSRTPCGIDPPMPCPPGELCVVVQFSPAMFVCARPCP